MIEFLRSRNASFLNVFSYVNKINLFFFFICHIIYVVKNKTFSFTFPLILYIGASLLKACLFFLYSGGYFKQYFYFLSYILLVESRGTDMKYKAYKHVYNKYIFYADSPEEMIGILAQLLIVAYDRNYLKKKWLEESDPDKKKELKIRLDCAIRQVNEIKEELERPTKND